MTASWHHPATPAADRWPGDNTEPAEIAALVREAEAARASGANVARMRRECRAVWPAAETKATVKP